MCPYCGLEKCETNRHHLFFPRKRYRSKLERKFRNLPCHVKKMCIMEHRELHRTTRPPKKPSAAEMRQAIEDHARKRRNH